MAARGGGAASDGWPAAAKPPSPRMKDTLRDTASSWPLAASTMSRSLYINAPLPAPLSTSAVTRLLPITVPAAGSGACSSRLCSPCSSLTQSMPVAGSLAQKPG